MERLIEHEEQESYAGPARVDGVEVDATLRGHLEPIDGRFHWYGRLTGELPHQPGSTITLVTPHGTAEGRLSDADTWGRLRITGVGRPPF